MGNKFKLVVALNAFKGSLNSVDACETFTKGFKETFQDADTVVVPVGDGGDGTIDALAYNLRENAEFKEFRVTGPLFNPVRARILVVKNKAYIEMAEASGLKLVPPEQRNPFNTTTLGTGELIKYADNLGVDEVFIGVGGSATVDGGIGALSALGFKFLAKDGKPVKLTGEGLTKINKIILPDRLPSAKITVLADVRNLLLGETGAARVYGPQKGATPEQVETLEKGLKNLRELVLKTTGKDINTESAGAAGGIPGALYGLLNAEIKPGIDVFLELIEFEAILRDADLVITGEGKFDEQTLFGKGPWGVVKFAIRRNVPVLIVAGQVDFEAEKLPKNVSIFSLLKRVEDLDICIRLTPNYLRDFAYNLGKLIKNTRHKP